MKKTQVSFEFINIFVITLFVFVTLIAIFPGWIGRASTTKTNAEKYAAELKVKVITASLSKTDYQTTFEIPEKINDQQINVEILESENMLLIRDSSDNILAKEFLPIIDSVSGTGNILKIAKTGDTISITQNE